MSQVVCLMRWIGWFKTNYHLIIFFWYKNKPSIFDDTEGGENIILKDKSGNELMFKTSEESIEITAQESLFLNAKKIF